MGAMVNLLLADDFVGGLLNVLSLIMMIADAVLVAFAVYMFFMMMTAHNEDKRRNVKKHFFNTLSSIFIILALIGTLSVIKVNITTVEQPTGSGGGAVGDVTLLENATIKTKTLTITESYTMNHYQYRGTFTITASDIVIPAGGATVSEIAWAGPNTSGTDFSSSSYWLPNSPSTSLTITYNRDFATQLTTGLKAEYFDNKPSAQYNVKVTVTNSKGEKTSKVLTGRIMIQGNFVAVGH